MSLTDEPGLARHNAQLGRARREANHAYQAVKQAAAVYLEAQVELLFAARQAHDDGMVLNEIHTSWLTTPPEEAVIEARVDFWHSDERSELADAEVGKIKEALRAAGYEPELRIGDIRHSGWDGDPLPAWAPPPPADRTTEA